MKSERLWNDGTIRWRAGERRNEFSSRSYIVLMSLRRRLTVIAVSPRGARRRRERSSTVRAKGQSFRFGERPLRAASPLGRADPSRTTVEVRFVTERRSTDSIPLSGVVSFRGGAGLGEGLGSQSFCRRFGVVPRNFRRGTTRER